MKLLKAGKKCCKWDGIVSHVNTGQVVKLDLSNYGLKGHLLPNSMHLQFASTSKAQTCLTAAVFEV